MRARVARFEGDPESIDARIERLRAAIESGDLPVELAGRSRFVVDDEDASPERQTLGAARLRLRTISKAKTTHSERARS